MKSWLPYHYKHVSMCVKEKAQQPLINRQQFVVSAECTIDSLPLYILSTPTTLLLWYYPKHACIPSLMYSWLLKGWRKQ